MSPALNLSASLRVDYNPKLGDGDGTRIRFYWSEGDTGVGAQVSPCVGSGTSGGTERVKARG